MEFENTNKLPEGVGKKIVDALKKQTEGEVSIPQQNEMPITSTADEIKVESLEFEMPKPQSVDDFQMPAFAEEKVEQESVIETQPIDEDLEIPKNIQILKQLITQLPPGVTRQTGAQIIRQTMEAMGIPMKSVLEEAQSVHEELGNSARDCMNTMEEYKTNIKVLERKVQNIKKHSSQVLDVMNLFIMTEEK